MNTKQQLDWRTLQPHFERFESLLKNIYEESININIEKLFAILQARLFNGINSLIKTSAKIPLMLIKMSNSNEHISLLKDVLDSLYKKNKYAKNMLYGGHYNINGQLITWRNVTNNTDNFISYGGVHQADWIEAEQLFGCMRIHNSIVSLNPGLIHHANGGILMLSLDSILKQPLMWLRLKKILVNKKFEWYSQHKRHALPLCVPSMPITFRLVLIGERNALADFQEIEPELMMMSIYSEFEDHIQLLTDQDIIHWFQWVQMILKNHDLKQPTKNFWLALIREATRYSGNQKILPLNPIWLSRQLYDAAEYYENKMLNEASLQNTLSKRKWRESFLSDITHHQILQNQILIETTGKRIGQINGLLIIEFPGHPRAFGEPCRISCVVHIGDGECHDIERTVELGGSIHAKGMMIMHAWLISELKIEHPFPLSASLVFEQSYIEIDGDSASLAELCVLISALAEQPITQEIAVTGSVDQFGYVQPVGGLNEKIESFFHICYKRILNGKQGVIIPISNVSNLSLHQEVIDAIRADKFHLWAVSNVGEALFILTGMKWNEEHNSCLLGTIKDRITKIIYRDQKNSLKGSYWLNWFKRNE